MASFLPACVTFYPVEGSSLYRVATSESTMCSPAAEPGARQLASFDGFWETDRRLSAAVASRSGMTGFINCKPDQALGFHRLKNLRAGFASVVDDGVVLPLLLLVLMFTLSGCGVKNLTLTDGMFSSGSSGNLKKPQRPGSGYLPADTGIALRPAEVSALLSTGDFDRGLSEDEMRDVILHFKSLVQKNRATVQKGVERGRPHIAHIRRTLREQRLPQDLAYLPFVESGYNPMATSRSNAAGMWQFIPSTGKHFGMEQNGWLDERRDPYKSTRAAASYLAELYKDLDDWHLAISAYNAGPGKIKRGLAAANAKTFFQLRDRDDRIDSSRDQMSEENKQYLPKFLAVCKVMRNLDSLGFPPLEGQSREVAEVRVRPSTDLMTLSKALGMSWKQFAEYNPAMLRYVSPGDRTASVYVPPHLGQTAMAHLSKPQPRPNKPLAVASQQKTGKSAPEAPARKINGTVYRVQQGDSLWGIARKFNVAPMTLLAHNNLDKQTVLRPGDTVRVP